MTLMTHAGLAPSPTWEGNGCAWEGNGYAKVSRNEKMP